MVRIGGLIVDKLSGTTMVPGFALRPCPSTHGTCLWPWRACFVQVSVDLATEDRETQWTWEAAGTDVINVIRSLLQQSADVIKELCGVAKANSDHLRKATGNKVWHARWPRRVADMLAQYRKTWESEISPKPLTKLFLLEWDTPMPRSTGVCFTDVYLDDNWDVAAK